MRIACILTVFPSVTETFVFAELHALADRGHQLGLMHFIDGDTTVWQEDARELAGSVICGGPLFSFGVLRSLSSMLLRRPLRLISTLAWILVRGGSTFRGRLKTIAILPKCVQFAEECRRWEADHVHATWANHAAVAALVIERLVGLPFSISAHAGQDVFRDPVMLAEKVAGARFVAVCNRTALTRLREASRAEDREKLFDLPHGVDLGRFPRRSVSRAGESEILFVGRLQYGKGLPYLLEAARAILDSGHAFRLHLVGDGPDRARLTEQVRELQLSDRVEFHGAVGQDDVAEFLRRASVFVLPSEVREDGGREGLPNAILEAMATGVPVVASRISSVEQALRDGESGLLVPQRDPGALAEAITRVLTDPDLAERLGAGGRRVVEQRFDRRACSRAFVDRFEETT